jgi:crotonobetainyl-CoA:carnitine CoA-transferase CaiB-like acyl-CoA transferase
VETERREYSLSPQYGEHTRTVLEQTGLTGDEIDGLMSEGVVL